MAVKVDGKALKLTANGTPSSICHHYSQKPTESAFVVSVPKPGAARMMAVVSKVGAQTVGYVIRTDAAGRTRVALLTPASTRGGEVFAALGVKVKTEAVAAKSAFASMTITDYLVLNTLGISEQESMGEAMISSTGGFKA
jgi:hypothetical protein